jgi:uncharacterized membrane protein YfcA
MPVLTDRAKTILVLLLTGALGGFLSGAFGVGGGAIMVPLLLWLARLEPRRAAATSLAAIVPAAIAGSVTYLAAGHVDLAAGALMAAGGIAGSLIGTGLLRAIPLGGLRWGFVALLVIAGVRMFLEIPTRDTDFAPTPGIAAGLILLGLIAGTAAGLLGIGGGAIAVPILIFVFGMSDLLAKGVSLIALVPTAITGTTANLRAHLVRPVDGLTVGLTATGASLAGAQVAFLMPARLSATLFGVLLVAIAVQLSVRAIRLRRTRPVRQPRQEVPR